MHHPLWSQPQATATNWANEVNFDWPEEDAAGSSTGAMAMSLTFILALSQILMRALVVMSPPLIRFRTAKAQDNDKLVR